MWKNFNWKSQYVSCYFFTHSIAFPKLSNWLYYSGREAPSLKMGSFCFSYYYYYYFFLVSTSGLMLIGWNATNMSSMSSGEERNVGEWSVLCFLALWTVWTLISRRNAYAGCGRPALNFIECFELGSLRSDTAKPFHQLVSLGHKQQHHMYTDYVAGLAWIWTWSVLHSLSLYYSLRRK